MNKKAEDALAWQTIVMMAALFLGLTLLVIIIYSIATGILGE